MSYCISAGTNKTLFGNLGDVINGWSFLGVLLNRCDNLTTECYNRTYSDSQLATIALTVNYISYEVDNYNFTQPYNSKIQSSLLPM